MDLSYLEKVRALLEQAKQSLNDPEYGELLVDVANEVEERQDERDSEDEDEDDDDDDDDEDD